MKAFVLAAGIGTRLRPLTTDVPKTMVPILGKPALYYTFLHLLKYGFNSACVNVHYRSEVITNYFKNNKLGIDLKFSHEQKLLGTAGAIKKNESFFDETFVVMSGDGLTDINLKKALEFHRQKKSIATIVLKKIDLRFEYGIAVTDKTGQIKSFVEKPYWGDVFNDEVNTGIYIFEPRIFDFIPKDKFFDFSKDLFPLLMQKREKIYGYCMDEYWTDIGNIFEYKKGIFDVLDGKVKIDLDIDKNSGDKYISSSAKIDKTAKIQGPCYIGDKVVIKAGANIKPYSVISSNVKIGENSLIEKAVIWEAAKIGENVKLINTIVGSNILITNQITLFDSIIMEEKTVIA
ncbi:MAG: NDP-sugar synthase [Endomicrobium sp.]|jgi:mannose-1-phosphate guanylyltransferase/phosphomannomutase|nr:NDP-sugar synthase [Endomicrobium sp.]